MLIDGLINPFDAQAEEAKGSKAVVRTAKELRRDFRVHTAHLALLLHR